MKKCIIAPIHHFYSSHREPLPKTIKLQEGYKIKKFDPDLLDQVFGFFGETFSEHDRKELRNCQYAIYYYYESPDESSETPEDIINKINRIILTLRVVKRTRAIPTIFHFRVRGSTKDPLQAIHKPLVNITFPSNSVPGSQHFNKSDSYKIRKYYKFVKELYDNYGGTYHKVLNALFFFELGHRNHLYKPRIVNFVTALESLFNTSSFQVGYTLRLRVSHFLEKNSPGRLKMMEKIKEIYNLRSTFVHGQGASKRILNNEQLQTELLSDSEEIVRRCLQKIFDDNLVQLFSDVEDLTQEFKKMELGLNNLLA